jgi:hypothetical protein
VCCLVRACFQWSFRVVNLSQRLRIGCMVNYSVGSVLRRYTRHSVAPMRLGKPRFVCSGSVRGWALFGRVGAQTEGVKGLY